VERESDLMKKILTLVGVALFALSSNAVNASIVLTETFDDSSQFETSTPFFADTFGDFFGLTGGTTDDFGGATTPPGVKAYTGFTGSILTGQDLDGEGATLPITVLWEDLPIAGETGLTFSGDFAEFFDAPGDIDEGDQLFVEAQIDDGGFITILEFTPGSFTSTGGPSNGFFELGAATLGSAAQNFTAAIAGTGTTLDLRLTVDLNSGDEDFAVDNFIVAGTNVPEPSSIALLGLVGLAGIVRRRK